MKKFVLILTIIVIPLILLAGSYFLFDPFKVIKGLASKNLKDYKMEDLMVSLNTNFTSTEFYFKNHKVVDYNAFTFGSSRGLAFKAKEWEIWLPEQSRPFIYATPKDNLYGISKKIKFLDEKNETIDHAFVLICPDITFKNLKNSTDYLTTQHPAVSHESKFRFQRAFFAAYFQKGFFVRFLDYKIFKKSRAYMEGFLNFYIKDLNFDTISNDLLVYYPEIMIANDSLNYYELRKSEFPPRDTLTKHWLEPQIGDTQLGMLREIKSIFDKHHTDYKIVISPLYNQKYFNKEDEQILSDLFGAEHVYNYSGRNSITEHPYNYYENSHYRIHVGKQIFEDVYGSGESSELN